MKLVQFLEGIREYLEGKKTYILAVVLAGYDVTLIFNIVNHTDEQKVLVIVFIMALMGMSLRASIKK